MTDMNQIFTQTPFTREEALAISAVIGGRSVLERAFWAMVKAGYSAREVEGQLRVLAGALR